MTRHRIEANAKFLTPNLIERKKFKLIAILSTRGIGTTAPETRPMKAAVSFFHEHGVFIKKEDQQEFGIEEGRAVLVGFPTTGVAAYEKCRDFDEIELEQEARMLLALFEGICSEHYSFLGRYGITEQLTSKARPPIALAEVYPELKVSSNTPFTMLYRKIEDVGIELAYLSEEEKLNKRLERKIGDATKELSEELKDFYETADCILGAGSYINGQIFKPVETSFGIGELDAGIISRIIAGRRIVANPFIVYWIIKDHCGFSKGKTRWTPTNLDIFPTEAGSETPIETITAKCYIPSKEIHPSGPSEDVIEEILHADLPSLKPFILSSDFLLPFSCPSAVVELNVAPKLPYLGSTPYGYIPRFGPSVPKISDLTKISVKFFDFPRFNRKFALVLDTSAIDISRFPLSLRSNFFSAFLENRELIIPKVVMHELKTRLRTKDRLKVEKALLRFNKLRTWGFVKNIRVEGTFPELSQVEKKDIEDLRDCMILEVARNKKAVVFTNDNEMIKLAALMGIYSITFSGLEEDVTSVIRQNNLKLTLESAIEKIKEYGIRERGEEYETEDIRWTIEYLCQQGTISRQRLDRREVLQYLRLPSRSVQNTNLC